jgi:hypothetical protein
VDGIGSLAQGPDLEGRVSEVRAWQTRRGWAAGVCLPQESLVIYGDVPDPAAADWAANLSRRIGPTLGRSGDPLVYPMSFDVGAHGEFYLLDAGRDRVLVLNSARQYVTEWGEPGNGEGQFDFGPGTPTWTREQDYGGSLVVDPQGRVWVADEYNQRIQVFEP